MVGAAALPSAGFMLGQLFVKRRAKGAAGWGRE